MKIFVKDVNRATLLKLTLTKILKGWQKMTKVSSPSEGTTFQSKRNLSFFWILVAINWKYN